MTDAERREAERRDLLLKKERLHRRHERHREAVTKDAAELVDANRRVYAEVLHDHGTAADRTLADDDAGLDVDLADDGARANDGGFALRNGHQGGADGHEGQKNDFEQIQGITFLSWKNSINQKTGDY